MLLTYVKQNEQTQIYYGETLATSIPKEDFRNKHIIVLTNQRYYDRFFEKIQRLFSPQAIDWYVCSNLIYCNHVQEFMELLQFLGKFKPTQEYLFVAFGNEGVVHLAGFLQRTTILKGIFWVLPASLQAYSAALVENHYIYKHPTEALLLEKNLPQKIFLDQTIVGGQTAGKLIDLQIFLRAGIVCDYEFLRNLFKSFTTQKQLQASSFTAFVADLTKFYQEAAESIESFGKIFEEAFYLTENGHLLSENMKRFLGILVHLFWNLEVIQSSFHIKNFMIWLNSLGFPIYFPEEISLYEYLENVLFLQDRRPQMVVLSEIGTIGASKAISEKELIRAMDKYQRIQLEIRGT